MVTQVISGDFRENYNRIILNGDNSTDVYDLTNRIWMVQNSSLWDQEAGYNNPGQKQQYPFQIRNQSLSATVLGGTVEGRVNPDTINWYCLYKGRTGYSFCLSDPEGDDGNSAAFFLNNWGTAVGTIDGIRMTDVWDGLRTTGNEFHLRNIWITKANDDAWEWDHTADAPTARMEGSLTDCFFEDCFAGHSFATNVGSNRASAGDVFTYTRLLLNTKARPRQLNSTYYTNSLQGGAPFKYNGGNQPNVILNDCVIGVGDVEHDGSLQSERLADKQIGGTGNYWLNLDYLGRDWPSGTGNAGYTGAISKLQAKGWTILDGPEAQSFFNQRRTAFINAWNGEAPADNTMASARPQLTVNVAS